MNIGKFDTLITRTVRRSISVYTGRRVLTALLLSLLALGGFLSVYVCLSTFVPAHSIVPAARNLFLVLCIALPSMSLLVPLLTSPTLEHYSVKLEELNPRLKDNLLAAIQLSKSRRTKESYSETLIDEVTKRTYGLLQKTDLVQPLNPFRFNLLLRSCGAMLILLLFLGAFMPSHFFLPLFTLAGKVPIPNRTILKVVPGDTRVVKGASVTISVTPFGRIPREISIMHRDENTDWVSESYSTEDVVRKNFTRIINDIHYKVRAKEVVTREYTIEVTYPPELTDISLEYFYPAYTKLPSMVSTKSSGNIVALIGTKVHVRGEATTELEGARVIIEEDTLEGQVDGDRFSVPLTVSEDQSYTIEVTDQYGYHNLDPPRFSVTAIPDEYPSVRIVEPGRDIDMPNDMIVPIEFSATDDFSISRMELVYSIGDAIKREVIAAHAGVSDTVVMYPWDLAELNLLPGKSVSYFIEVHDNDTYSGPKAARSESYSVNFPTLHDIYERIAEEERRSVDEITGLLPEQQEIYRQLDEIATKLKATKDMAWEKRETVEDVIEKQQQIVEEVERLSEQMEMAVEQMKEGLVVDEEILTKMAEVARLLKEVMTDEMRDALEKLRQAMESLKPDEIEKALGELKFTQQELSESLERTLQILNRIKQERRLKQLADEVSQLRRQEEALKQKTESAQTEEELAALSSVQEKIRESSEQLEREMSELSKELSEISDLLQENAQTMQRTSGKMAQASGALRKGMKSESLSFENQILEELASLEESLTMACSSLSMARKKEIMEAMQEAISDLVYLSKSQERTAEEIERAATRAGVNTGELAISESVLGRSVAKVADKVYGVGEKTLFVSTATGRFLGMAMSNMKKAEDLLEDGKAAKAGERAGAAMQNLNQATLSLMNALSSCQVSACASGVQELLQNMTGLASRQGALNEAAQSMLPLDVEAGGLSMAERAQLSRLAAEQQAIQEGVSEFAEAFAERADLAGRLDDVVREMKDIARSLERHQLDRSMIERQERILSRLLDAQRSVRRRDYTRRRKAETGENVADRESPEPITPEARKKLIREDMLRALKEGYPPEYENLIKAYFKALSESIPE